MPDENSTPGLRIRRKRVKSYGYIGGILQSIALSFPGVSSDTAILRSFPRTGFFIQSSFGHMRLERLGTGQRTNLRVTS